jgi:hypothetical protein
MKNNLKFIVAIAGLTIALFGAAPKAHALKDIGGVNTCNAGDSSCGVDLHGKNVPGVGYLNN